MTKPGFEETKECTVHKATSRHFVTKFQTDCSCACCTSCLELSSVSSSSSRFCLPSTSDLCRRKGVCGECGECGECEGVGVWGEGVGMRLCVSGHVRVWVCDGVCV